jgi:hypothetical protein
MKHTAHYQLYNSFNFRGVFNKNLLFILLCGTFLMAGHLAHAQLIQSDDFESTFGNWNDGGGDCRRDNSTFINGDYNIRVRNGSGSSNMTSDPINLTPYSSVRFEFLYYTRGLENSENFYVEYDNGNGSFVEIANFRCNIDFANNNTVCAATITLSSVDYAFSTTSRFRIRCDANESDDRVYIDDINIFEITPPTNDSCSNPIVLIPGSSCNPVIGATIDATQSYPGCTGTADDDVWYSFVATYTSHTILVEADSIGDIVFEVFEGGCGGSSLVCEDSTFDTAPESATLTSLTIGTIYHVRVYTWSSANSMRGTFSICILDPCTPGNGNGVSTYGCPGVNLSIDSEDETISIDCDNYGTVMELEADFLSLGDTNSYSTEEIPYNPPYQFECLANPIFINDDDVWSPVINFSPNNFDFCFYGESYNSCTVNANGVISFDTDLAEMYTGWEINNSLPSTANSRDYNGNDYDYGPSIFGVHHDIDPRRGGEIGWEFMNVTSGGGSCRALVTSWHDVPMYADNSILYSGMIILYENSNIIEIYVEEKNMDNFSGSYSDIWNFGNAQIGIQDETSTEATVIKDIGDGDWTVDSVNSRAWRFVPDGASISDLIWLEDGVHNQSYDGNSTISISPTVTTTFTAEVTYNLCNSAIITASDDIIINVQVPKVWEGSESNDDWMNPLNWSDDTLPALDNCVRIPDTGNDPVIYSGDNGNGLNLTINNGASLTQEPNSTLTITKDIFINTAGTYELQDSSSLIQIDDVTNTVNGTFAMDRTTTMRVNDYVYWSSPVTDFNIENISPGTPNGFKYQWLPFANRTLGLQGPLDYGEWDSYNTGAMDVGRGYIIKGPNGHSSSPSPFSAKFYGNPNNGDIIQPIERSGYTGLNYSHQPNPNGTSLVVTSDDDNWNLIGNPYPSALNVINFLTLPANSNIYGMVYLWTHGTNISTSNLDPFYEDYTYNYDIADYIAFNSSGTSTPSGFDGNIGAGQGFFILMNDLDETTESVTFNNSMRSSAYANDQFYRNADASESNTNNNRIWLDYISPNGNTNTTLIAYVEGATNGTDRLFDAINSKGSGLNLYSLIDNKNYLIQGRQLPFDTNDMVPLGINISTSGLQTIAINTIEGLFEDGNNQIFVEDLENGIIHNLKNTPYTFSSEDGIIDDRFVLRYSNSTLGLDDFDTSSGIKVFEENERIIVKSQYASIASVAVFDILGRSLFSNTSVNLNSITINALKPEDRILFFKIILTDGNQKITKLIF